MRCRISGWWTLSGYKWVKRRLVVCVVARCMGITDWENALLFMLIEHTKRVNN